MKAIEIKTSNIDILLDLGFELAKTSDYRTNSPKLVLAMDTNTFIEKILKQYGVEKDISTICPDCYYNDESVIEIDLNKEEIKYIRKLQGEQKI